MQQANLCGERRQFFFIDGSLINGVRNGEVDEFAAKDYHILAQWIHTMPKNRQKTGSS